MKQYRIQPAPLLFLFFPLLSFAHSCTDLRNRVNGFIFVLFYALFGFYHSFLDTRGDAYRKMLTFTSWSPFTSYTDIWDKYLHGDIKEPFERLLYVFVRGFTNSPHILFFIVGAVGGYFVYLSILSAIRYCEIKKGRNFYITVFSLVILLNPVLIGGIRNFLAISIFMYSTFLFLVERKSLALIGLAISPLIHFSFWLSALFVITIRYVLRISPNILWWFVVFVCIASIFIETQDWASIFKDYSIFIGQNKAIANRVAAYSSEGSIQGFATSLTTQLMKIQQYLTRAFVLLGLILIKRRTFSLNRFDQKLYHITLYFLLFGYLFVGFSVVGERYLVPGLFFFFLFLYRLNLYEQGSAFKKLVTSMFLFFPFNIGWILVNSFFLVDHRFFYIPLPFLWL